MNDLDVLKAIHNHEFSSCHKSLKNKSEVRHFQGGDGKRLQKH